MIYLLVGILSLFITHNTMPQVIINSPVVISQSGNFTLGSDIIFDPLISNTAAFIITTSTVVFDLGGHFISFNSSNTQHSIDAIYATTAMSNVTIQNGTIQNFNGTGIHVADACSGVKIYNCNITSCLTSGIWFDGSASGTGINLGQIQNCIVIKSTGANGGPAYGMRLVATKNLASISNIFAFNDAGFTTSGYGIDLEFCSACQFLQNSCSFNGGIGEVAGFRIFNSTNCGFLGNVSNGNTCRDFSGTGTSAGYLSNQSTGLFFDACRSLNNSTLSAANSAYGFLVKNGSKNFITDSLTELTTGGGFAAGFGIVNESKTVVGTSASKETSTSITGTAVGIYLTLSTQCQVKTNQILNTSGISGSFGVWDASAVSSSFVIDNT